MSRSWPSRPVSGQNRPPAHALSQAVVRLNREGNRSPGGMRGRHGDGEDAVEAGRSLGPDSASGWHPAPYATRDAAAAVRLRVHGVHLVRNDAILEGVTLIPSAA
jgi:hypothetical protein